MSPSPGARIRLAGAAVVGAACLTVVTSAPARAAEGPDCAQVSADATGLPPVTGTAETNDELGVPSAAQQLRRSSGRRPGEGVSVVVVDTPFEPLAPGAPSTAKSAHGLVVASIIGGPDQGEVPVGIAQAARIVERPYYTVPRGAGADGEIEPSPENLAQVLGRVATEVADGAFGPRTVVVVPSEVPTSETLTRAVDALAGAGALIVAAGGDRPVEGQGYLGGFAGAPKPGEDAAQSVWPAADEKVLAVGATANPESALRSSAIDLGAPGTGSVARAADGKWCVVSGVSTHWAAAQAAGVAALVWSGHPGDDAAALRQRLLGTAAGSAGAASRVFGYGQVQADEALDRAAASGTRSGADEVRRAAAPRERVDVLADEREQVVVWGIVGGASLVVLMLLRPVLARRRAR